MIEHIFNTNIDSICKIQIGIWEICLHSDMPMGLTEFINRIHPLLSVCNESKKIVDQLHLYFINDSDQKYRLNFEEIKNKAETFIPDSISEYYASLSAYKMDYLPPQLHCNRYYHYNDYICAEFPFPSDDFFLVTKPDMKQVCLYGKENCLQRVLMDILSMEWNIYPFHGSAVLNKGKADCFLGNSDVGKSTVAYKMFNAGCAFLADDMLFIKDNFLFPLETKMELRIPTESTSAKIIKQMQTTHHKVELGKLFVLHKFDSNNDFYIPFLQCFPSTAKQSAWLGILWGEYRNLKEYFNMKTKESVLHMHNLLNNAENVYLDFSCINNASSSDYSFLNRI